MLSQSETQSLFDKGKKIDEEHWAVTLFRQKGGGIAGMLPDRHTLILVEGVNKERSYALLKFNVDDIRSLKKLIGSNTQKIQNIDCQKSEYKMLLFTMTEISAIENKLRELARDKRIESMAKTLSAKFVKDESFRIIHHIYVMNWKDYAGYSFGKARAQVLSFHKENPDKDYEIIQLIPGIKAAADHTPVFLLPKAHVKIMLKEIERDRKSGVRFDIVGRSGPTLNVINKWIGKLHHNCFTWAAEKLLFAGIKLPVMDKFSTLKDDSIADIHKNVRYTIKDDFNAVELAFFAKRGRNDAIKAYFDPSNATSYIDRIIQLPEGGLVESSLCKYNALCLAVAYNYLETVKLLVETYGANIYVNSGRRSTRDAINCAKRNWWGLGKPQKEILLYLQYKDSRLERRQIYHLPQSYVVSRSVDIVADHRQNIPYDVEYTDISFPSLQSIDAITDSLEEEIDHNFIIFGTDRESVHIKLSVLEYNKKDCEFLAEEIFMAFITYINTDGKEGFNLCSVDKYFECFWTNFCAEYNELNEISDRELEYLNTYFMLPNVFNHYINAMRDPRCRLTLGHKSTFLYARESNINLYIWYENDTENSLELVYKNIGNSNIPKEMHISYIDYFTGFKLLPKISFGTWEQPHNEIDSLKQQVLNLENQLQQKNKDKELGLSIPLKENREYAESTVQIHLTDKQTLLIESLLKGDFKLVKELEIQGASFFYISKDGTYPLVAAVYSCNLELVRYVEGKLGTEAKKQWEKVDIKEFANKLNIQIPTPLSNIPTYTELGNWYDKFKNAVWCITYDQKVLKGMNCIKWGCDEKDWSIRAKVLTEHGWKWGKWMNNGHYWDEGSELYSPSVKIHEDTVKAIREQLNELSNYVYTKCQKLSTQNSLNKEQGLSGNSEIRVSNTKSKLQITAVNQNLEDQKILPTQSQIQSNSVNESPNFLQTFYWYPPQQNQQEYFGYGNNMKNTNFQQQTNFFPPSQRPIAINSQQQENQNQLIEALLAGDFESVKKLESRGGVFTHADKNGLYPLVAAVYGCNLKLVQYIEEKLKDEANKQWEKVDLAKANERINNQMPTPLPLNATYSDLGNWYEIFKNAPWSATYDQEVLNSMNCTRWGTGGLVNRGKRELSGIKSGKSLSGMYKLPQLPKGPPTPKPNDRIYLCGHTANFYPTVGNKHNWVVELYAPSVRVHEDVVKIICEQLNELRKKIETKTKQLQSRVDLYF